MRVKNIIKTKRINTLHTEVTDDESEKMTILISLTALIFGTVLASIVLLGEILVYRYKSKKNNDDLKIKTLKTKNVKNKFVY